MKKLLKFILSLSAITIATSTSLNTIACNNAVTESSYVVMYRNYYNWNPNNPYLGFLNNSSSILNLKASVKENQKFNSLYDDGTASRSWNDISLLETTLTTTQLSPTVTLNINWDSMYDKVGLNLIDKSIALTQQLRFYNILAKLYKSANVLKLLQWIHLSSQQKENVIAYNSYYPELNSQTQTYGLEFADKKIIKAQYNAGFWSSDNIITVSTHEYGHALSNFLGSSKSARDRFNTTYINENKFNINNVIKLNNNLLSRSFSDRTQILINFLDKDAIDKGLLTLDDNVKNFLFALLVVKSRYSQSAWSQNDINHRDDFFAEAFTYWMLTPEILRNVSWSLLNDFFIDYIPVYYNL